MKGKSSQQARIKECALSHEKLLEILRYDPKTGLFVWKKRKTHQDMVGKVAGFIQHGHRFLRIDNMMYPQHRLAWFYVKGEWPKDQIEHEDLDGINNKWTNLRESTQQQNVRNRKAYGASGFKGVHKHSQYEGWIAQITIDGKVNYLGSFRTPEEAHEVYVSVAKNIHQEFGRFDS